MIVKVIRQAQARSFKMNRGCGIAGPDQAAQRKYSEWATVRVCLRLISNEQSLFDVTSFSSNLNLSRRVVFRTMTQDAGIQNDIAEDSLDRPKRALVLSGGGGRGAYQVGVLKALTELGIDFDVAFGTSVGGINAAFYAQGKLKRLEEIWCSSCY